MEQIRTKSCERTKLVSKSESKSQQQLRELIHLVRCERTKLVSKSESKSQHAWVDVSAGQML